jgi:hypothetical protein
VNKDLVSVIGNFVSRIIKFAISRFDAKAFPTTRSKRGPSGSAVRARRRACRRCGRAGNPDRAQRVDPRLTSERKDAPHLLRNSGVAAGSFGPRAQLRRLAVAAQSRQGTLLRMRLLGRRARLGWLER